MAAAPAGPWGAPAFTRLVAELSKGWPSGLTVLTGDDLFHLDKAQAALLGALIPAGSDPFACTIVGDGSISTGELAGAARSIGMFAARRVVFLRDVAALHGDPEPLVAFAKNPPSKGFVIVRAPKLDRKRKLGKALAESGRCLVFRAAGEADRRELVAVIRGLAAERRVELADDAVEMLVAVYGGDLHRMCAELDKLAAWLGDAPETGRRVDGAVLRTLVSGASILSGWELSQALLARDRPAALEAARRLVDAGDEPIRIVGGLAWRARTLLRAKAMSAAGASPREVVAAARAWSFERDLSRALSRYRLEELLAMPGRLLAADRALKSRGIDPRAVLEELVFDLMPKREAERT